MTTTSQKGLAVGRWIVDPARSTATFRVRSLGRTVTGTVPVTEGTVDVDSNGLPTAISGELNLGALDTGNPRRDKDLREPKFLDLDRYPAMTFAADTITGSPVGWRVAGTLAVRGTSARLTGDAAVSPQEHDQTATVTAHTQLDRRAIGIQAPGLMIGHTIDITVTATLRLPAPP